MAVMPEYGRSEFAVCTLPTKWSGICLPCGVPRYPLRKNKE